MSLIQSLALSWCWLTGLHEDTTALREGGMAQSLCGGFTCQLVAEKWAGWDVRWNHLPWGFDYVERGEIRPVGWLDRAGMAWGWVRARNFDPWDQPEG